MPEPTAEFLRAKHTLLTQLHLEEEELRRILVNSPAVLGFWKLLVEKQMELQSVQSVRKLSDISDNDLFNRDFGRPLPAAD